MRETTQVRAMDDYFHSLLLDDVLLRDDPDDEAPASAPQLQPQPAPLPEVVAAPYLEADSRLAQLSELLAQVSQVQDEMDVLSHEEVHVEPFQLEVEAEPEMGAQRGADDPLAKLHAHVVEDAPFVWIAHDVGPRAMSAKVKNVVQPRSWFIDIATMTMD